MKLKFTLGLLVCLSIVAPVTAIYAGAGKASRNICNAEIISQIQEGKSSRQDVTRLIGEPLEVEKLFNDQELWRYVYARSRTSGGAGQSFFGSSAKSRGFGSGPSLLLTARKNCNVHVVFGKDGIVTKVRQSNISGSADLGD